MAEGKMLSLADLAAAYQMARQGNAMGTNVPAFREQWPGYQMYPHIWDAIDNSPKGNNFFLRHDEELSVGDPVASLQRLRR